jgi:hypothetical protein
MLKEVIDAIIASLSLPFDVDIITLFNYNRPIDNIKCTASTYYSFAFLAPHSTQHVP